MLETIKYLSQYLKRYRRKYVLGLIFVLLTNVFRIINPRVVQKAIDYLKDDFSVQQLGVYVLLIISVAISEGIFLFLMRRNMIVASREIENDLRNDFFLKLLKLPPSFYQRMPTGDVMSRATNDLNAVRAFVGPGIAYSINTLLAFCFVIPMMVIINPRLTLFALLPFPVVAILVNRFGRAIYKRFDKIQAQFSTLSTRVQENLSGNTIIKWFAREDYEIKRFREDNREYMNRYIAYAKVQAAFFPSLMMTIGLSIAIIILIGGRLVIRDEISVGEFTAFMLYMNILIFPSIALGWVIGLFQQGSASMKRMRGILEAEADVKDQPGALNSTEIAGEIAFCNLNFQYTKNQPVLKEIDFTIPAKSTVGIIGPTGSGKSTLIKLIPHFYPLPTDVLLIDRIDINDYAVRSLRSHIGYVSQETFLFSDTIANNIAYGKQNATQEEIEWAARMANIHEEIESFPEGYQSMLGEKGINLSGGQKQRISIARAIIRQPRILILDDAFSALDTQTEENILRNLHDFFPDRTVILVSHRVSTLQHSDFIVVMENGMITEKGTHDELLQLQGHYAWIYEKQLLEEELEKVN